VRELKNKNSFGHTPIEDVNILLTMIVIKEEIIAFKLDGLLKIDVTLS
jgi:hypothetical protein